MVTCSYLQKNRRFCQHLARGGTREALVFFVTSQRDDSQNFSTSFQDPAVFSLASGQKLNTLHFILWTNALAHLYPFTSPEIWSRNGKSNQLQQGRSSLQLFTVQQRTKWSPTTGNEWLLQCAVDNLFEDREAGWDRSTFSGILVATRKQSIETLLSWDYRRTLLTGGKSTRDIVFKIILMIKKNDCV